MKDIEAILLLEDRTIFRGKAFGFIDEVIGEVVFNTSMMGYQEILTDPSYYDQIVTMTYPQIGNYGTNDEDIESNKINVRGFIVREYFDYYSNWRGSKSISDYLKDSKVMGISEIDTRKLTRHIRSAGAMKGIISTKIDDIENLHRKVKEYPGIEGKDLVKYVTCDKSYYFNNNKKNNGNLIIALDYGIKFNILRCLDSAGFNILVVPAKTSAEEIISMDPDGVFLSNGPGDPAAVTYAIENIKRLIGKIPLFGICLGHQLLALALGAETYKLKFGHHGANHPVKNMLNGKIEITTQNHGFSVGIDSLNKIKDTRYKVTHMNLNDNTIEGVRYDEKYAFSVQHHPEAGPGPHDARYIFDNFKETIKRFKKEKDA